jgi:CHAT domain-containing protein
LWWCPTGLLSFLPLHAARARGSAAPSVLDRVASSYTPTILALLNARRRPPAMAAAPSSTLIVAIPETPGYAPLPGVTRETAMVRRLLPGAKVLAGPNATARAVSDALDGADLVHLACHGEQDLSSPSDGRLLMYDGVLTVRSLARHHAGQGQLAVLSCCETVRGGVELADEAVTLAAAVQLAGFRSVIGALWAVGDLVAVRFVADVYGWLTKDSTAAGESARGVHLAVCALRDRYAAPWAWASFVHVGP